MAECAVPCKCFRTKDHLVNQIFRYTAKDLPPINLDLQYLKVLITFLVIYNHTIHINGSLSVSAISLPMFKTLLNDCGMNGSIGMDKQSHTDTLLSKREKLLLICTSYIMAYFNESWALIRVIIFPLQHFNKGHLRSSWGL